MKTKTLIALAAIALVAGIAAPARAGVSVSISFGVPVVFPPPLMMVPPPCPLTMVAYPTWPVCAPPAVVAVPRPVYYPATFVPPGHAWKRHHSPHDQWGRNGHGRPPGHAGGRR